MNNSKDLTDDEEGLEDDGAASEGEEVNLEHQNTRRGKGLNWTLLESFESIADYKSSHIYTSELSKMSMRKATSTKYAERETFECKYARRKAFLPCCLKFRVNFDTTSDSVTVEKCGEDHSHENDPEYGQTGNLNYLRWTEEQTEIIMSGVRNDLGPTVIRRNLKDSNLFNGSFPSYRQINKKIAYCRKLLVTHKYVIFA